MRERIYRIGFICIITLMVLSLRSDLVHGDEAFDLKIRLFDPQGNQLDLSNATFHVSSDLGYWMGGKEIGHLGTFGEVEYMVDIEQDYLKINGFASGKLYILLFGEDQERYYQYQSSINISDLDKSIAYIDVVLSESSITIENGNNANQYDMYLTPNNREGIKKEWGNAESEGFFSMAGLQHKVLVEPGSYNLTLYEKDLSASDYALYAFDHMELRDNEEISIGMNDQPSNTYTVSFDKTHFESLGQMSFRINLGESNAVSYNMGEVKNLKSTIKVPLTRKGRLITLLFGQNNDDMDYYEVQLKNQDTIIGSQRYYYMLSPNKKDDGGYYLIHRIKDENGNEITASEVHKPDKIIMTFIDKKTGVEVASQVYPRYYPDVTFPVNYGEYYVKSEAYNDTLVNAISYFELSYYEAASKMKFLQVFKEEEIEALQFLPLSIEGDDVHLDFELANIRSSSMNLKVQYIRDCPAILKL